MDCDQHLIQLMPFFQSHQITLLSSNNRQVTDPQELGEGRNKHTYYRIDVHPPSPKSSNSYNTATDPISSVRRRYSDFQWLFQRLHAEKPGAIIPIIPHTQAMASAKRFSEELVEERRGHLERFLRRVQIHPELEGAPSLSAFFSPDAEVFEAAKKENPSDVVDETLDETERLSEKVKHFFVKKTIQAKVMRGGELEETGDGQQMQEIEQYLDTLENHVKSLSKATLYLVSVSEETSKSMHELGQTLFGLHQTYDPESALRNNDNEDKKSNLPSLKAISNVFASLSAINKVKYDENSIKVSQPVQDTEWSIKSARLAVKRRKERQLTYNTYLQQIKNRQAAIDKLNHNAALNPPSPASDSKMAEAQKLLDSARHSSRTALEELDSVTQRVFREMDRFKVGMDEELRKIYVQHAKVQVDYSQQLDGEWRKLLPTGGGGSVGGGGMGRARSSVSGSGSGSQDADILMI